MAKDPTEPLLKQAESFYVRSHELTEAMEGFKNEAAQLESIRPNLTEEEKLDVDWKLHKADSARRAAIKFMKRGDKLMKRWEKYNRK